MILSGRLSNILISFFPNFIGVLPFIFVANFILLNINFQFYSACAFPLFHVVSCWPPFIFSFQTLFTTLVYTLVSSLFSSHLSFLRLHLSHFTQKKEKKRNILFVYFFSMHLSFERILNFLEQFYLRRRARKIIFFFLKSTTPY